MRKHRTRREASRRRAPKRKRPSQASFGWRTRGGKRRGAGRKPKGQRAGVPHRSRGVVLPTTPVHVGLKVAPDISNLRHPTLFGPLRTAIYEGAERFGMRVIHYSVIEDHLHFIVEAEGGRALARGMQGLTIRMAKRINKVLGRKGRVFVDRYWSRVLRSPSETRAALSYVLKNKLGHNRRRGIVHNARWVDYCSSGDRFTGWEGIEVTLPDDRLPIGRPRCWYLKWGWMGRGKKKRLLAQDGVSGPVHPSRRQA
jgi:REP element-mobilizing transposase RayT